MSIFFIKTSRSFYALALCVFAIQQFEFGTFRNSLFPSWQFDLPLPVLWAYLFGIFLLLISILVFTGIRSRQALLVCGSVFLSIDVFAQAPYNLISDPNLPYHLGIWDAALKQLAYAGGAFIIAGTYSPFAKKKEQPVTQNVLEKLVPFGNIFFCTTMIAFGIAHFIYEDDIKNMVPEWIPDHPFWTYFAGVALIGSGLCIMLDIRRRLVALLLCIMIFLWFLFLHIPDAYANPVVARGNETASAFDALLFSGVALAIASANRYQYGDRFV